MRSIGVRELRQHASRYLREVERGETIEVTDRGRPVAVLSPVSDTHPLEELTRTGRADPPVGDLLDLGPPLEPTPGAELPSRVLARLRADER
jgi:prevent-host-death family protein